ncbi:MAG: methionyl-tRNA formyltransferase [bacterium]|nr:methionyl-tRNA formyltransferase [bacterium]
MRVVFFGTPELAVPSLAAVAEGHEVTAVVCQPDRPKGRGKKMLPPPTKVWAEAHGILVHQPTKLNSGAFEAWLKEQAPEACVIAAYGRLLKQPILDVPPKGWLNLHPSLLPKYRGPSPIQSAVLNGETVTGCTIMRLTLEMDAGDILLQEETPIGPDEDAVSLTDRLAAQGGALLARAVGLVARGEAEFTPQDHDKATYCTMLEKADGRIRWGKPAREIHNLVRGALPWPTAQALWHGEVCRIHRSTVVDESFPDAPGTVVRVEKDRVVVATGEGGLAVLVFQAPGKRAMPMGDYLRGSAIAVGDHFEEA